MTDNDPIIRIPGDKSKQCIIYRVRSHQGIMLSRDELYMLYDALQNYFCRALFSNSSQAIQFDGKTAKGVMSEFKRIIKATDRGLDIGTSLQGDLF